MDWLDRMNEAMNYIESHLEESLDFDVIAAKACCSTYHFQRMFSYITSIPLSEYIRRRRLTLAAFELQTTGIKVIDVAMKYGYDSPEAFSRAFKSLHGAMPAAAKNSGTPLKAFPRMTFSLSIKGDVEMNYRIEEKESFKVFGLTLDTTVVNGQCYREIPEFWMSCATDGRIQKLLKAAGKGIDALIDVGITYNHQPDGTLSYMIGCYEPEEPQSEQWSEPRSKQQSEIMLSPSANEAWDDLKAYTRLTIPKQTWAIFPVKWLDEKDDANIHETWRRIYAEWFPAAKFEHADCDFDIEIYEASSVAQATGFGMAIWIPVVSKG